MHQLRLILQVRVLDWTVPRVRFEPFWRMLFGHGYQVAREDGRRYERGQRLADGGKHSAKTENGRVIDNPFELERRGPVGQSISVSRRRRVSPTMVKRSEGSYESLGGFT